MMDKAENELIRRLKESPFYQLCQDSFRKATALPLALIDAADPQLNALDESPNQNAFCQLLNSLHGSCATCIKTQQNLIQESSNRAHTCTCFAGLMETMVPVQLGIKPIGFLKTGQVLVTDSEEFDEKVFKGKLIALKYSEEETTDLLQLYKTSAKMDRAKYDSMIVLLGVIALQMAEFLNRLLLETKSDEPDLIREIKAFVMERIDEKISLTEVAEKAGVSVFYFCKLFKKSTGMTFTEFVNRKRVELAKGELVNTDYTIIHIAYSVGYQSLSQFNRSFLKYAGESPSKYREKKHHVSEELLLPPVDALDAQAGD